MTKGALKLGTPEYRDYINRHGREPDPIPGHPDTKEAREWLQAELGKAMPEWLAERVVDAVMALILAKLADFSEMMAERSAALPNQDTPK